MRRVIKKGKKKHLRNLPRNKSGREATVRMSYYPDEKMILNGRKKRHYAHPSITFKGEGKSKPQTFTQALEAGELYEFKKQKRAERFAAGSWKKGEDKREAMKAYRKNKKGK